MFTPTFVSYLVISISVLLLAISHSASSKRIKHIPFSRPELRLDRYLINDETEWTRVRADLEIWKYSFDNDFISKNGSDYTIAEDVVGVMFVCEAKYPIEIVFPSIEQIGSTTAKVGMTPERVSEFNEDLEEPMTQKFRLYTYLSFENIKFFSSTLACQSVNKKRLSSSTHLYKLSMDEIERKGQTIQLTFDKKQNSPRQLELPCRPASPTASIFLQKQTQVSIWDNGKVSTFPVWNEYRGSKKFDPKTGITLTLPENQIFYNSNPDGLYKCILSEGSDDDYVLVNVTTKSVEPDKKVFHSKFTLKANASFGSLEINSSEISSSFEIYKCCSGVPLKPPSLIVKNCDSLLECDIEKARLLIEAQHISLIRSLVSRFNHSSDCSVYVVYGLSSIFMCEGENVDVSQQYFQMFRTPENDGNKSRVNRSFYEPNSVEWNAKVERRIVISIARPDGGSLSENDGNTEVFYKRSHHFDDDAKIYISQTIFQVNSDIYEGESISFMCLGLYLFHAEGGYIRINWKNGTKTVLPDFGNENIMVQFSNKLFSDSITVNPILIKPIEASRDMRSVECFQPVWNESRWERMEMSLEVKASFEPVFSGSPEEIVYFNLNEKECEITCQLSGGTPLPHTIEVTKDEKSLVIDDNGNLSNATDSILVNIGEGIVTIKFPAISYEIHGIYQCTAENFRGEAVRTIRVIVKEKSSRFVTAFLIFIGLMAGILCLAFGLRFWVRKKFFPSR